MNATDITFFFFSFAVNAVRFIWQMSFHMQRALIINSHLGFNSFFLLSIFLNNQRHRMHLNINIHCRAVGQLQIIMFSIKVLFAFVFFFWKKSFYFSLIVSFVCNQTILNDDKIESTEFRIISVEQFYKMQSTDVTISYRNSHFIKHFWHSRFQCWYVSQLKHSYRFIQLDIHS